MSTSIDTLKKLDDSCYRRLRERTQALYEAQRWRNHIGAVGRTNSIGSISRAHSHPPKLVVPIQYTSGGNNYHDSPDDLNKALLAVIVERQDELLDAAFAKLQADVDQAVLDSIEFANDLIEMANEIPGS